MAVKLSYGTGSTREGRVRTTEQRTPTMPCVAGQRCIVPAETSAPPLYTATSVADAAATCTALCRIPNLKFEDELKRVCEVCVIPREKPKSTTGKKPQSSSNGTDGSLGKNGHDDEGG